MSESSPRPDDTTDGRHGLVPEAARFFAAGVLSYSLGVGLAAIFSELVGLRPEASVALSLGVLLVTNFWVARQWVFRSSGGASEQFIRFALTSFVTRGGEYVLFWMLLRIGAVHYLVSLTIAMGISSCVKFVVFRTLVFGRRPGPTAPLIP